MYYDMLGLSMAWFVIVGYLGMPVRGDVKYKMRNDIGVFSSDESSNEERAALSARHCAHLCAGQAECRAANYNNGSCVHLMAELLEETEDRPGNIAIVTTLCLPNPCNNNGVCTGNITAYSCSCVGNYLGSHCDKQYVLTLRVDDEGAVYSKGAVLHDSFAIAGGQAGTTYTINLNTDVLVLKRWNGGGGGGVVASVNGVNVSGWRCVAFSDIQDPEVEYPGSTYPDYDDSAWTADIDMVTTNSAQLCRAKLTM